MKSIRVQLQGGLGNQLFIWAMAHEINFTTGKRVQIEYVIDRFQRKDRPIEIEKLLDFCEHEIYINQSKRFGSLLRVIDKIATHSVMLRGVIVKAVGLYDCKTTFEVPDFSRRVPRIIRGYFQSLKMVEKNKLILGEEIDAVLDLENQADNFDRDLVVHIRRGDTREISTDWGVLSMNYYLKQIRTEDSPLICIDDAEEVDALRPHFPNATFLTPEITTTWQTLKILSEAKTLIIANSTLSWWAAWLKSRVNPETVFFPDTWRPAEQKTFEKLRIESALFVESDFEA